MDAAGYEDLAGRLYGLVVRFSGRLHADQAGWLHHVIDAGEYGLALEDMAGMLARGMVAITGQERGGMLALAGRMNAEGNGVRRALAVPARGQARPGPGQEGS